MERNRHVLFVHKCQATRIHNQWPAQYGVAVSFHLVSTALLNKTTTQQALSSTNDGEVLLGNQM